MRSVYHKQGEDNMGSFGLFGAVRREVKFIPKMPASEPFWKRLPLGILGACVYHWNLKQRMRRAQNIGGESVALQDAVM